MPPCGRAGRGPAALECAIDVWGKRGPVALAPPMPARAPRIDEDAVRAAAKLLGAAKRVLIVAGGGAQDASAEVTPLSDMLQAPVLAYRRGRGVLDGRDPLSVTLPLGRELWGEADVVLGVGTRLLIRSRNGASTTTSQIVRVDADPRRAGAPAQAGGGADRRCRADPAAADRRARRHNRAPRLAPRRDAGAPGQLRQARSHKLAPQLAFLDAIRAELPEDGIFVDEVTQIGFAARLAFPVYQAAHVSLARLPGQSRLGLCHRARRAARAAATCRCVSISGDGGFMFTANELATAMRHRIPLVAVVFNDGAFGNVRRIQEEQFGNRLIASDLANPDFVRFAESFGAAAGARATRRELRAALKAGLRRAASRP